jgi:serine O-acetyltransferase
MATNRLSWRQTFRRIRADRRRLAAVLETQGRPALALSVHPSFVCVLLYRVSNHFFRSGHRYLARACWHLNTLLTGADISEPADLGEGLVIVSPPGTTAMGTAGRNLTMMPCSGLGGEVGRRANIGAGPGVPLLGDDVVLEAHAGVLGPVRIGHQVRVPPGVIVTEDVADYATIETPRLRVRSRRQAS